MGHGPFSHTFEHFIQNRIDKNWSHEIQSEVMFRSLIKENHIDIEKNDVNFIISLIQGKYQKNLTDNGKYDSIFRMVI